MGISFIVLAMMPLVMSAAGFDLHYYGLNKGPTHFWDAVSMTPAALFSLKLSLMTSSVATACNVVFGIDRCLCNVASTVSKASSALMIVISLPTAIPTAVAGFALLLVWGRSGNC